MHSWTDSWDVNNLIDPNDAGCLTCPAMYMDIYEQMWIYHPAWIFCGGLPGQSHQKTNHLKLINDLVFSATSCITSTAYGVIVYCIVDNHHIHRWTWTQYLGLWFRAIIPIPVKDVSKTPKEMGYLQVRKKTEVCHIRAYFYFVPWRLAANLLKANLPMYLADDLVSGLSSTQIISNNHAIHYTWRIRMSLRQMQNMYIER